MFEDRIEAKWIDSFVRVFEASKVQAGDDVAILSETQSRNLKLQLCELALLRIGARPYHVMLPTPPQEFSMPVRSNGRTTCLQNIRPVVELLASSSLVADNTVEGIQHTNELREILERGTRVLHVMNDHPDVLERFAPDPLLKQRVTTSVKMMRAAKAMRVTSKAGSDLTVDLTGAPVQGTWGFCDEPGHIDFWPGGMVACFPAAGTVNGTIVIDVGDLNLTFKRYVESPIRLTFENDYITSVDGDGVDAELFKNYNQHWGDREAWAASHLGWGLNDQAHWEATTLYDKRDTNGGEQRCFAGNVLFSTGTNPAAGRETHGHYDIPLRACTVTLDNTVVVDQGRVVESAIEAFVDEGKDAGRPEMLSTRYK